MLLVTGNTTETVVVELCVVNGTVVAPELADVEDGPAGDIVVAVELMIPPVVGAAELTIVVAGWALLLADMVVVAELGAEVDTEGEEDTIPAEVLEIGGIGLVLVPGGAREVVPGPITGPLLKLLPEAAEDATVVEVAGEDTTTLDVARADEETDMEPLDMMTAAVVEVERETVELSCAEETAEVGGAPDPDELDGGITWLGEVELDAAGVPEGERLELGSGLLVAGKFEVGLPAGGVVWTGELDTGVGLDDAGVCIPDDDTGVLSGVEALEDVPSGVVLGLEFPESVVDATTAGVVVDESAGGGVADELLDDVVVVSSGSLSGTGHAVAAMPPKVTT